MLKIQAAIILLTMIAIAAQCASARQIANYTFDTNGTTIPDSNGQYNLSKYGTPGPIFNIGGNCKHNNCSNMTRGNLTYHRVPWNSSDVNGTNDYCLSAWIDFNDTTVGTGIYEWIIILDARGAAAYPFGITVGANYTNSIRFVESDGTFAKSYEIKINYTGGISHYVFCRDYIRSNFLVYENSTLKANTTYNASTRRTPTGPFNLTFLDAYPGASTGNKKILTIDEVRIYNNILTQTEINALYNEFNNVTVSSCDCPASGDYWIGGCTINTNCAMSAGSVLYLNGTATINAIISGFTRQVQTTGLKYTNYGGKTIRV